MNSENFAMVSAPSSNGQPFTLLGLDKLDITAGIQSRAETNPETVEEYAEAMARGVVFPPIIAFFDGLVYWLVDGFHRVLAARKAGLKELWADVRTGTERDARLFATGVNRGLRRSNADKRHAVTTLLMDPEWWQWSDQRIADHCGVSDRFVSTVRKEIPSPNGSETERLAMRNGTTYTMNTENIGKVEKPESILDDAESHEAFLRYMLDKCGPATIPDVEKSECAVDESGNSDLEQPGDTVPEPVEQTFTSPECWAQQTWISVNGEGPATGLESTILIKVPETMPLNRGLQAYVSRARKLGCSVFLTPNLKTLVEDNRT